MASREIEVGHRSKVEEADSNTARLATVER
jgi:hypothetical protein